MLHLLFSSSSSPSCCFCADLTLATIDVAHPQQRQPFSPLFQTSKWLLLSKKPLFYKFHPSHPAVAHPRVQQKHSLLRVRAVVSGAEERIEKPGLQLNVPGCETLPPIWQPKRVVLVRHGQSTWNEIGRIQGSSNFAVLTAKGESQAETSRQMLLSDSFDLCFHSPLARAKRTAEIIWGFRKNAMIPIEDLREIDLYSFQGLMKNEGKQLYGEAYRTWQKDAANFSIDGHYPVRELWERAQKCWSTILCSEGRSILVVAHNAVNQALVATAAGLGPEYFRQLLQSNCGVSVLDFTPRSSGEGLPFVCLDRLNQKKFATQEEPMNMLGIIQSTKTAELLLDVAVGAVFCSPQPCALETASAIVKVQEAADCLGADCVPRSVELIQMDELKDMSWGAWRGKLKEEVAPLDRWEDYLQHEDVAGAENFLSLWERAGKAWQNLLKYIDVLESQGEEKTLVVVGHEIVHVAMLGHCLGLSQAFFGSFRLDSGSLSVIDFPDGSTQRGVIRCLNYTAHLGRWAVPVTCASLADEKF
ncbi:hypothetical protein O6H91_02G145900 [Diphasiastrum complanatum]|uniref:Uncharacterized protein n=1 Tax=Diphasiastrum complanatum TaxID=34168 RepID=A0ACC2ELS8_DIPCM|nr:hypothetical protein O6H91_02G145900 [Diphasiastrum complanatum]